MDSEAAPRVVFRLCIPDQTVVSAGAPREDPRKTRSQSPLPPNEAEKRSFDRLLVLPRTTSEARSSFALWEPCSSRPSSAGARPRRRAGAEAGEASLCERDAAGAERWGGEPCERDVG